MTIPLDAHGQPPRRFYAARVAERSISELLGLCKGMVCDGIISDAEARALQDWMAANPLAAHDYPGNVLARRLNRIFADHVIDEDERLDLYELLQAVVGTPDGDLSVNRTTSLPLDEPPPPLIFPAWEYVFTGKLAFGTRRACEMAVLDRGGIIGKAVTLRTHVLVVGALGSIAWKESTHGTKILRALEIRDSGRPIHLVAESHWVQHLA